VNGKNSKDAKLQRPLDGQLSGMVALWHSPRTYDRRLFLQHLHDNAGFTYQHHRGIDERAERNQASDNGTQPPAPERGLLHLSAL